MYGNSFIQSSALSFRSWPLGSNGAVTQVPSPQKIAWARSAHAMRARSARSQKKIFGLAETIYTLTFWLPPLFSNFHKNLHGASLDQYKWIGFLPHQIWCSGSRDIQLWKIVFNMYLLLFYPISRWWNFITCSVCLSVCLSVCVVPNPQKCPEFSEIW